MRARLAIEWSRDNRPAVLVAVLDAIALTHGGSHRALSRGETRWLFQRAWQRDRFPFRPFAHATELTERPLPLVDDTSLHELFVEAIELGSLVGLRPEEVTETPSETTQRRALLRELQGLARGRFVLRGERYHVVTDVDLERLPDRREFDVVPRAKAEAVLEEVARLHRGRFAALLTEVRKKLTADWAAPLTPDGFILLRLRPLVRLQAQVDALRVTPSQLKALAKSQETTWIEVVLEDQDGEPVADCSVVIRHESELFEQGRTDDKGVLRLDPTEAGKVTIEFPDYLDESNWQDLSPLEGQLAEGESGPVEAPEEAEAAPANADADSDTAPAAEVPADTITPPPVEAPHQGSKVTRVRLIGMHFDHAKTFLLPSALEGIRKLISVYAEHPGANLLVVGHTDTRHAEGDDAQKFNRQLSLDRAKAVASFLTDDVHSWSQWYDVEGDRRWGTPEDKTLLSNVPPGQDPYYHEGDNYKAAVSNYQASKGLPNTGTVGPATRAALIADYMSADGTTLPEGATLTVHGCGPYFPDKESGPNDDVPENRRVEIFVFDGPIEPAPTGEISEAGSPEYPAWVAQVGETVDFQQDEADTDLIRVRLLDTECHACAKLAATLWLHQTPITLKSDDDGWVSFARALVLGYESVVLEYRPKDADVAQETLLELALAPPLSEMGARQRLANLGYRTTAGDAYAVDSFQFDWGLERTGILDEGTIREIARIHDAGEALQ